MGLTDLTPAPAGPGLGDGAPATMGCAIRAYGLGRKFRRATALEPLDLEVPAGAIYGLVGPRAAGKTTCIKVLLNILPPSAGRAEVLGADSRRLAPRDFAQIGYLAEDAGNARQDDSGLLPPFPERLLSRPGMPVSSPPWSASFNCASIGSSPISPAPPA